MTSPARSGHRQRWSVLRDAWRTQLWPLPTLAVTVAVGLGVGLPLLDATIDDRLPPPVATYLFGGGPGGGADGASVIAGSLITVTSLTFSLTVVTLQLASSQFSPRLLRTFTRDRLVHATLALLLATFTYAVTVLRTVRTSLDAQTAFVPQISVTVAYLLGLISVLGMVLFLAHLARQIRVESMLREVHTETADSMRRLLSNPPEHISALPVQPATATLLCATSSGFLTSIDETALLSAAVDTDAIILLDRLPGDSVIAGTPVAAAWSLRGSDPLPRHEVEVLATRVPAAVRAGFERTAAQDVAYGLRQLVDVVVKALSPGINDPTTAVHALGHIAALLCDVVGRDLGPRLLRDDDDRIRVVLRRPDFTAMLELAVAQPRRYGAADPEVLARLLALLREVAWCSYAPATRQIIAAQLQRTQATVALQKFDHDEQVRLDRIAGTVTAALAQQWPTEDPRADTAPDPPNDGGSR